MVDDVAKLSARLEAIEKILESVASRPQVADLTAEDIKAFKKVRDVVAFDPDSVCGINECFKCISVCRACQVCVAVCRVCKVCDFECTCGPCNGGALGGRLGRFGNLGE